MLPASKAFAQLSPTGLAVDPKAKDRFTNSGR